MLVTKDKKESLGIYIHWPFCQAKCPYCDFNSHVRTNINQHDWTEAYIKSLKFWKGVVPEITVNTIFFGGGTPSLMEERTVYEILQNISNLWKIENNVEITLEANPTSTEKKTFFSYRNSGVNRLSLGVQAFNDLDLKRLGRLHSASEAKKAINVAKNLFDSVSLDLMYGRQYQTLADWKTELKTAISFSTEHLSLYQLTIEDGTRFGDLLSKNKLRGLPTNNEAIKFYNTTQELCNSSGLYPYEISNHSLHGKECKHNLKYWNSECFLGIGPGSHGRVNIGSQRVRTEAPKNPESWFLSMKKNEMHKFLQVPLTKTEKAEEYAIMGIRLLEGFDISKFQALGGKNFSSDKLDFLRSKHLISTNKNRLKTTQKGKLLTNEILRELLC